MNREDRINHLSSMSPNQNDSAQIQGHAAQDKALQTLQLLTLILSHLSPSDLIRSVPLVCNAWNSTCKSPAIQTALFLQPTSEVTRPTFPDILVSSFPIFFKDVRMVGSQLHWPNHMSFLKLPWSKNPSAWNSKDASWRNMLISQPPCTSLEIIRRVHAMGGDFESCCTISRPEGVRMGLLYDITLNWCSKTGDHFAVQYNMLDHDEVDEPPLMHEREVQHMEKERWESRRRKRMLEDKRRRREERKQWRPVHVKRDSVTVVLHSSSSCTPYYGPRGQFLEPELRSEGYEDVKIEYGEAKNVRGYDDWLFYC